MYRQHTKNILDKLAGIEVPIISIPFSENEFLDTFIHTEPKKFKLDKVINLAIDAELDISLQYDFYNYNNNNYHDRRIIAATTIRMIIAITLWRMIIIMLSYVFQLFQGTSILISLLFYLFLSQSEAYQLWWHIKCNKISFHGSILTWQQ